MRGQEVLLIRRKNNGWWDVPGGRQEADERPEGTARRELQEETGLSVSHLHKLGIWQHQHIYPDGNVVDWTTHVSTAQYMGGECRPSDDAKEIRWWPLNALPTEVAEVTSRYFGALCHEFERL